MSNASSNRNRWMLPAPKAPLVVAIEFLRRPDVWTRVGLCALTTTILWIVAFGWAPPFQYRVRNAPVRDLHAKAAFKFPDREATDDARDRARSKINCLYVNDPTPLEELRRALIDDVFQLKEKTYEEADKTVWAKFFPADKPDETPTAEEFEAFKKALELDSKLESLRMAADKAFLEFDKTGLMENLEHEFGQGSMEEIEVYRKGNLDESRRVQVSTVRKAEIADTLEKNLQRELKKESEQISNSELIARRVFSWLKPQLPVTLKWDEANSRKAAVEAATDVGIVLKEYQIGDPLDKINNTGVDRSVVRGGVPLETQDIALLRAEHEAVIDSMSVGDMVLRSFFFFGLYAALFSMISGYLYFRDRRLIDDLMQFSLLLGLMLVTLTLAWVVSINVEWRSEVIPIVMFALAIAIAYNIELSIILSALVALAFTVTHGFGLGEFVILTAASSTAALLCRSIRSRTKLVYIGLAASAIVFPTVIGVQYLLDQPLGTPLFLDAAWFSGATLLAGLFMTALLPFLESLFDIQTDISLLELSDANHPLLKELVQRAPGTYNHSINVASISEAAADAIGANGLLCRVGAYFHDVGKLRKPEYFIENQGGGQNKHDTLVPTMSTLVIVAHVKDGAEIARTHRLPKRIVDLIMQHHGTTLVEYFYNRATKQSEESEDPTQIDEADYRYPGPRPQTREAAVMMLADGVESASRALREPTPARIESLVREIAKKKLDDGQFDECEITIQELNMIQESLIKSLNAMYHARVKYPDQQTA